MCSYATDPNLFNMQDLLTCDTAACMVRTNITSLSVLKMAEQVLYLALHGQLAGTCGTKIKMLR